MAVGCGVGVLELLEQRGIANGVGGVQVEVKRAEGGGFLPILFSFLPLIFFSGLIFYMLRRSRGGINQALNIGRSQAQLVGENRPPVTFADVAGAEAAWDA